MKYVCVAALILVATAGSASAGGGPPATPPGLVTSLETIYTPTDAAGRATGPAHVYGDQGPPSFVDEQAAKGVGAGPPNRRLARASDDGGTPSTSGCGAVESVLTAKSITTLFTVYKYHVKRYWCWRYGHRVSSASTDKPWFTNIDPNFYIVSVSISPHGWFYLWCCGDSRSGHYAFRQGQVNNCILKYGCIGTTYPTIELFLHGNGTWHSRKSGA